MNPALPGIWIWWAAAAVVAGVGLAVFLVGLRRDRGYGTRRCPRCWYDMSATAGRRCPECGREARDERALLRRRRRKWVMAAGVLLLGLAAATAIVPRASVRTLVAWSPRTAVIMLWPDGLADGTALDTEIERFVAEDLRPAELWGWQRRMLARRCGRVAEEMAAGVLAPLGSGNPSRAFLALQQAYSPFTLLAETGPEAAAAVPALGRTARSGSEDAIKALENLGPLARPATADLIAVLEAGATSLPAAVPVLPAGTASFPGLTGAGEPIVAPPTPGSRAPGIDLSGLFTQTAIPTGDSLRIAAFTALAAMGEPSPETLAVCRYAAHRDPLGLPPQMLRRLVDDAQVTARVVPGAIEALARFPNDAAAIEALRIFAPHADSAVPVLTSIIQRTPPAPVALLAVRTLAAIGPGATAALPALDALAAQRDGTTLAIAAEFAAARIRGRDAAAADDLLAWLAPLSGSPRAHMWDHQLLAADLLGELEAGDSRITPALERAANAGWSLMERQAPAALGLRAAHDPAAADALARLLAHTSPDVRLAAATALIETGAAGTPALPALRAARRDKDPRLRTAAAIATARIEGASEPAR